MITDWLSFISIIASITFWANFVYLTAQACWHIYPIVHLDNIDSRNILSSVRRKIITWVAQYSFL